ncbi:MAG: twin-arginine translocase subunit TatC [Candidatus Omnitrophica bacterium]|nr:twin-arginine translocase subunit TatC [Candidatus Omnitrophota bacterium]
MEVKRLTFVEHLEELRSRLIKSIIFLIIASCISYAFKDIILDFVVRPVGKLVFIAPQEAFITNIKIAFLAGLYLSLPFLLYEVWGFISVGLKGKEKKYALIFGLFSFINFVLGILFGYFIIVPIGMRFLLSFSRDFIVPMLSMGRYISFIGTLTFVSGVIFELPIAILFLTKIGVVTPGFLSKNRKYAIVIIFIIAAIFTPPDIITQCLMAVPLMGLYELSIVLSRFVRR